MPSDPYRRIASAYERVIDPTNRRLHSVIRKRHPAPAGSRILDIGCGTGAQLEGYLGEDRVLAGIDLSPSMLERARHRLGPEADLRLGSATELPFQDGSFDQVLCSLVLHEIPSQARLDVLGQVRRVLAPDGRLITVEFTTAPGSVKGRLLRALTWPVERLAGAAHFRHFRDFVATGGFPALADRCGLRIESSFDVAGGNMCISVALVD